MDPLAFLLILSFVVVLHHSNSISVVYWQWYHVSDGEENVRSYTFTDSGIFNLPHHTGMVWEELAFDYAVSYTQREKWIAAQLNVMAVVGFVPLSSGSPRQCLNQLSYLSQALVWLSVRIKWLNRISRCQWCTGMILLWSIKWLSPPHCRKSGVHLDMA